LTTVQYFFSELIIWVVSPQEVLLYFKSLLLIQDDKRHSYFSGFIFRLFLGFSVGWFYLLIIELRTENVFEEFFNSFLKAPEP